MTLLAVALPAGARTNILNYLRANATTAGNFSLYDYTQGSQVTFSTQTQFSDGVLTSASATAVPDSVVLASSGLGGWWNSSWQRRRCYTVTHTGVGASTVTEYQVKITLDTAALIAAGSMRSDAGDLRAISATNATIPLWLEGPINSTTSAV